MEEGILESPALPGKDKGKKVINYMSQSFFFFKQKKMEARRSRNHVNSEGSQWLPEISVCFCFKSRKKVEFILFYYLPRM